MNFFKHIKRNCQQIKYDNLLNYISVSIEELMDVGHELGNSHWNIKHEIDKEVEKILQDKEYYL